MFNSRKPSRCCPSDFEAGAKWDLENCTGHFRAEGQRGKWEGGVAECRRPRSGGRLLSRTKDQTSLPLPGPGLQAVPLSQGGFSRLFTNPPLSGSSDEPCGLVSFPLGKNWGKLRPIDKEADLLPWPQLLAGPLQDFPGPSERGGETRGQAWAGWETLESPRQPW